ncbi:hypothetical protein HWV62_31925 [Athelia sp. TMB]|nr:hypothetical protein HWV62_31925 [Athelia sp. TMB]
MHTVVIRNHWDHERFLGLIRNAPPEPPTSSPPLAHSVENIWIAAVAPQVVYTYNACQNIRHIALVYDALQWLLDASSPRAHQRNSRFALSEEARARTQELHLTLLRPRMTWPKVHSFPTLKNVTRLRFADYGVYNGFIARDNLQPFPNLTHLAIETYGWDAARFEDRARPVLSSQTLRMFVLVITTSRLQLEGNVPSLVTYVRRVREADTRLYLAESVYMGMDIQPEWEDDMRSGRSIWDRAVEYTKLHVDARRR